MYDWGDLRFLLATARTGSTSAAAGELGVNQTTVARRIASLEAQLGVQLFERRQDGYRLTEAGAALRNQAERVQTEAETLAQLAAQHVRILSGVVRVTTTELLANFVLTPWLGGLMDIYPDIRVEVIATDRRLDLARGEADVSIRASRQPTEPAVVFRRLANANWALYCSTEYAKRHGAPERAEQLDDHLLIGVDGDLSQVDPLRWVAEKAPRAPRRSVCSNLVNLLAAIKAGHGVGPLPCSAGDFEAGLVRCLMLPLIDHNYYLITAARVKDLPRIRAFNDFLVAQAGRMKHMLEGRGS